MIFRSSRVPRASVATGAGPEAEGARVNNVAQPFAQARARAAATFSCQCGQRSAALARGTLVATKKSHAPEVARSARLTQLGFAGGFELLALGGS